MNITILVGVGINLAIIVFALLKELITKLRRFFQRRKRKKQSYKLYRAQTDAGTAKHIKVRRKARQYAKIVQKRVDQKNKKLEV